MILSTLFAALHDDWLFKTSGKRKIAPLRACAVLNKVSEQIRQCLEHAEYSARQAAVQPDGSPLREDTVRKALA
jgi:hypothetical protein